MKPDRETFVITLKALRDPVPADARLRQFLKAALRRWNLKCVDIRGTQDGRPSSGGLDQTGPPNVSAENQ